MCGIFGTYSSSGIEISSLRFLAKQAEQRGRDSSGLISRKINSETYEVVKSDEKITKLLARADIRNCDFAAGHSRLVTNGFRDNQPVVKHGILVLHNGIVTNVDDLYHDKYQRELEVDTEIINDIIFENIQKNVDIFEIPKIIFDTVKGVVSCACIIPKLGKILLFSNNGSLFYQQNENQLVFASEKYSLDKFEISETRQLICDSFIYDLPEGKVSDPKVFKSRETNIVPGLTFDTHLSKLLQYKQHDLKRCKKCILPETMPFISFNSEGICNYCENYKSKKHKRDKNELLGVIEQYRKVDGIRAIVPFSGGRDSCWGLHLMVKELGIKPITYTYDWGMVTDLGRRNISKMCGELNVENIIIAADIEKKRNNIRKNLISWLKSPSLGMVSILTAGDKHFFKFVEDVKKQTDTSLNIWSINPLETTHFKAGFLGVKPNFLEDRVYISSFGKQVYYQKLRFIEALKNPGYFNTSVWDTLSGEYYRSFHKKKHYYHLFDYWNWNEIECNNILENYGWEKAIDTNTTWRIGDGTAAFYNYIYYTAAGFTEHDTFRSNQVREGDITREQALELVADENRPRYQNIKWYLDVLDLDFEKTIKTINKYFE